MTVNFVIGVLIDLACAGTGVLALVRARRCTRGRFVAGAAGVAFLLYALIAIPWRVWLTFVYHRALIADPGEAEMMALQEVLAPLRTISGSLVLTAGVALLIGALVAQARDDAPRPQPHGHPGAGPYNAAYAGQAQPQPHAHPHRQPTWSDPRNGPAGQGQGYGPGQPPAPGTWSPPPQPGQSPPHGASPPEH